MGNLIVYVDIDTTNNCTNLRYFLLILSSTGFMASMLTHPLSWLLGLWKTKPLIRLRTYSFQLEATRCPLEYLLGLQCQIEAQPTEYIYSQLNNSLYSHIPKLTESPWSSSPSFISNQLKYHGTLDVLLFKLGPTKFTKVK